MKILTIYRPPFELLQTKPFSQEFELKVISLHLCLRLYWLIRERYCFIKKTICGSNVVLRTVCSLYFNEIQRLFCI